MKQMGSLSKIISMLPGANSAAMKKQMESLDDDELIRTQSIVQSMTPTERREPKILNGSRRARIAKGSGRTVTEVNQLVDRFTAAQKMMRQMRTGGAPAMGLPAMPGALPGLPARSGAVKSAPAKKKSRSGNPAKRAQDEGR